jgi:hypothetical protein
VQRAGQAREPDSELNRDDRADRVLPVAADVEEAATERERDGKPGQDQRRDDDQRLIGTPTEWEPTWKNQFRPVPSKIAL